MAVTLHLWAPPVASRAAGMANGQLHWEAPPPRFRFHFHFKYTGQNVKNGATLLVLDPSTAL